MNKDTLLYRIINPDKLVQSGKVSSQAFRPKPQDDKMLSVYDGDQIAPDAAWRHYSNNPDMPLPYGVLGVSVAECSAESLPVRADPETFPEHVLIDFREFSSNQVKRKSANLRNAAEARGWLFYPQNEA